jgi:hypothetical protein
VKPLTPVRGRAAGPAGAGCEATARPGPDWAELAFCVAAFAMLCAFALSMGPRLIEPDDYAYQGSVIALSRGHLALSAQQYRAVAAEMEHLDGRSSPFLRPGAGEGSGIPQWHQEQDGNWISEKNPGYPFLAVPFYDLGIIRLAPLWYGLLACGGLFLGARRWLRRRFAGAAAVALYCSSGAAALFAWRDYLPTFTDASLVAAGTGAVLWAVLADDARSRRRAAVGLLGFLALEAAAFTRYTDVLVLGVAVLAVIAARRQEALKLPAAVAWGWLGSAAAFAAALVTFNGLVYGSPAATGYKPGEITFGLGAVWPNLGLLPRYLIADLPMLIPALAGCAWITLRGLRARRSPAAPDARRDLAVGAALALSWLSVWGLYLTYTWTTAAGSREYPALGVQCIRFYVPALGAMALLGAWLLVRLPRWLALTAIAALYGIGYWSFTGMSALDLLSPHPGADPGSAGRGG